jgi:hypothetical protein
MAAFDFGVLCLGMAAFCSGSGACGRLALDEDAFGPPGVRGTAPGSGRLALDEATGTALGSGRLALDEAAFGNGLALEEAAMADFGNELALEEAAFADFGIPCCNKNFVLKHPRFKSGK